MASPFPPNAVLTFSVTSGFATDPKTGNKVPVATTIEVEAYLKSDSRPRGLFYPGIDEQEEPLVGRAIEELPDGVANLSKAWATLTDPVTGKAQTGRFTLYRGTPSAFGTESVLGPKISGVFRSTAASGGVAIPQPTPGQYPATTALAIHKLVAIVGGSLVLADQTNLAHADAIAGMTLNAAAVGQKPQLARAGLIEDSSWNWIPGQPIFLGTNGNLTQDGSTIVLGFLMPVGWVPEPTKIYLEIEEPIFF